MSCSDNVVRAGLTPKYKDVENLLSMLIYEGKSASEILFKPEMIDEKHIFTSLFRPPVEDFAVAKIEIPQNIKDYEVINSKTGSIILVISGNATMIAEGMESLSIKRGSIIFVPSKVTTPVKLSSIENNFTCYQAMYNDF
jgi:mannose-6-phosphate isomerase